jgi:hypothetical protein
MRTESVGRPDGEGAAAPGARHVARGFEHREMPYEKLVEELQPQRNLSFDPICQVFFACRTCRRRR